jgi:adenosylmethionine-8-amino-7-oxononanoate aminotransferase
MSHAFWHPFADMASVSGHELVIVRGEGSTVVADDGRAFLDATAGLWYCNVGHGRVEIADAVRAQMVEIASYSCFGEYVTQPTLDLADRLAGLAPMADARVFLTSGGSDSVDTAVKMVRRYWSVQGQPSRSLIVTRTQSYHGMHLAGTSLAGIEANRIGQGPLDRDVVNVPWDDAEALAAALDDVGPERVAAFFCEPVLGAGGVRVPPPGYLARAREVCRERGVLFVADEVICGYGRTGRMFASEGIDPDLVLTAKGLTSGYLPMGAVLVSGAVAEPIWQGGVWRHGYTYSGHASASAAALANLDIIEREQLVERVADHALTLAAALAPLRGHAWVSEVRAGTGLLAAVQIDPDVIADDPTAMGRLIGAVRERGVLTRPLIDGSLQISPPFVMTRDEMARCGRAIDEALTALGSSRGAMSDVELLPEVTTDEAGGFESSDARLLAEVPPHHG